MLQLVNSLVGSSLTLDQLWRIRSELDGLGMIRFDEWGYQKGLHCLFRACFLDSMRILGD
jgi:hypothetical protein